MSAVSTKLAVHSAAVGMVQPLVRVRVFPQLGCSGAQGEAHTHWYTPRVTVRLDGTSANAPTASTATHATIRSSRTLRVRIFFILLSTFWFADVARAEATRFKSLIATPTTSGYNRLGSSLRGLS